MTSAEQKFAVVEKRTHWQVQAGNDVLGSFAGPAGDKHAAMFAAALAHQAASTPSVGAEEAEVLVGDLVAATLAEDRAHEQDASDSEKDSLADSFIRKKDRVLRAIVAAQPGAYLLQAVDSVLEAAPCGCAPERRYEDGRHLSGCYLCDLHLARQDTLATPKESAEPAPVGAEGRWRPEVIAFADAMERKLKANDHKGGWRNDTPSELLDRVFEELQELCDATVAPVTEGSQQAILDEGADVANMVMMVVDVCRALPLAAAPALAAPAEMKAQADAEQRGAAYTAWWLASSKRGREWLKAAVEGECDGLALTDKQADAILEYISGWDAETSAAPAGAEPKEKPFTEGQLRRLYDNSPEVHDDTKSFAAFKRIVRLAEGAHRIGADPDAPPPPEAASRIEDFPLPEIDFFVWNMDLINEFARKALRAWARTEGKAA